VRPISIGDRVTFRRADGIKVNDVVRLPFTAHILLEPFARNTEAPALVLTEHSWCLVSDVVAVTYASLKEPS